ncbi:MAG: hypothetical protein J6K19_00895 [Prevotella sp.]|nr:hypothetical protein [Prevotella sp.]
MATAKKMMFAIKKRTQNVPDRAILHNFSTIENRKRLKRSNLAFCSKFAQQITALAAPTALRKKRQLPYLLERNM